jgi:putative addiction module component (TIGR02574 family)
MTRKLNEKQGADPVNRLINSLDEHVHENIEQAWIVEVRRRKEDIKSGNVTPVPGEEVHKEARKLLNK